MTITEVFEKITAGEMAGWALAALFVLLSLIQISPLKLNPWDNIFAWLGKKLNGATEKRLQEVEKQVSDMWINNHRQCILTFARECRSDISHSSDEWSNVLNVAEEYERYGDKGNYHAWICSGKRKGSKCASRSIREETLMQEIQEQMGWNSDEMAIDDILKVEVGNQEVVVHRK